MKTNKDISENQLRELFKDIPFENPSPDFTKKLMMRIEKETVLQKEKKQQWITVGQMVAGVSLILFLPALAVYLCTLFIPDFTFAFSFPKLHFDFDPNLIVIGFSILMLLIADTLFRVYVDSRSKQR